MTSIFRVLIGVLILLTLNSCYSFRGISVPPEITSYFIGDITRGNGITAPTDLTFRIQERVRLKLRNQTNLRWNKENPDMLFEASINVFNYTDVAPTAQSTTSLSRLNVGITFDIYDSINDETTVKKYTDFEDFDKSQNISDVESELIDLILEDISERLVNDLFSNW